MQQEQPHPRLRAVSSVPVPVCIHMATRLWCVATVMSPFRAQPRLVAASLAVVRLLQWANSLSLVDCRNIQIAADIVPSLSKTMPKSEQVELDTMSMVPVRASILLLSVLPIVRVCNYIQTVLKMQTEIIKMNMTVGSIIHQITLLYGYIIQMMIILHS